MPKFLRDAFMDATVHPVRDLEGAVVEDVQKLRKCGPHPLPLWLDAGLDYLNILRNMFKALKDAASVRHRYRCGQRGPL